MARSSVTPDASMTPQSARTTPDRTYPSDDRGVGWLLFAGTMLALVGTLNVVYGIAAVDNSKFYVRDVQYIIGDLNTWGWIMIGVGALQLAAAFSVWARQPYGRWVGIITAGANAIVQMLFIPSFPFLSLSLFTLDILIIYGLVAYGGRRAPA
ncbi:MAG: hypothetical protein QOH43_531 [Solirubrobacteraceae bacterium]|jgi:hypothetical protein|nr:hypothetical protein [Solirubrobacteraceae bacterium]